MENAQNVIVKDAPLVWTRHPIIDWMLPPLTTEAVEWGLRQSNGIKRVMDYWERHETMVRQAEDDPLNCAPDLPCWGVVRDMMRTKKVIFDLGANGSGKTEMGGKLAAETVAAYKGQRVLCVATNEDASIHYQQRAVYKYLPKHAREYNMQLKKPRHKVVKINYTPSGGFTDGNFMLLNRSECSFKTVAQYERDPNSFEGPEYDLVWIDEPAPISLVDTLIYRARKRAGRLLLTFTSLEGFTLVCARAFDGARVVKCLPMQFDWFYGKNGGLNPAIVFPELKLTESYVKGCPPGHMPFVMQPANEEHGVVFTWTHWNPFLPRNDRNPAVPDLFMACTGKGREEALIRLFGWTQKTTGCQLANLDPTVHVIPHERIEKMLHPGKDQDGLLTTYMAADPVTARSYALQWKGVDRLQRQFIIDEFPRMEDGEWVTTDGRAGEGQRRFAKLGIRDYKRIMREREAEHGCTPVWRKGDPRAFATAAAAQDGGVTLFELFAQEDRMEPDNILYAPMHFDAAQIRQTVKLDIDKLKDLLAYNEDLAAENAARGINPPTGLTPDNEPHLYISDRCKNTIRCWEMWDGTADHPAKDFCDATRYNFDVPAHYQDPNVPEIAGGVGW